MPKVQGITDTQSYKVTNRTVKRLNMIVRVQHAGLILPNLRNVTVKATLNRGGKDIVIMNDNLAVLARESHYYHTYEFFQDPAAAAGMAIVGADVVQQWPLMLDLRSPINVMGSDQLIVEVQLIDGWYGTGVTNTNGCYIDFSWREDIGVETFIPIINSKAIQAGVDKVEESLGDNVLSVAWVNLDVPPVIALAIDDTTSIIQKFGLTSDKYRVTDDRDKMIARRYTDFEAEWNSDYRWNTFLYTFDGSINNVNVDFLCTPTNITVGKNALVWRSYHIDRHTLARAEGLHAKHEERNKDHVKKHLMGGKSAHS